ncbi:hypothetical protein [Agrococcus sp. Marseille-Q4369]|uniref:hypothetical protein n=1 Tax=Agrococcus sp. Marseille-Q4369 TaxID=2810513 RepID=UPI001B8AD5B4|nr:hypothetical protein [Agrococcus sp. Marseille-Q4369]QUW18133.1 hypothetical protein JSQ78_09820 [Agrococcus sp. Marseille-Q4369]
MEIRPSARKHGVDDADIEHAWRNAIRLVEYDYQGEARLLAIGPELVALPVEAPARIIHADRLRPKFYDCLR